MSWLFSARSLLVCSVLIALVALLIALLIMLLLGLAKKKGWIPLKHNDGKIN